MKLNSSLKFLFISFLAISFIAGLGLFSGLSYLKETTYGVSERTIAENIRSLTKEAALYRDAQGINEILSAIYKKGYYFRVSLPDNFTVIYPKDLFSPIWKEKPDHIIQSQTASKELLIIEVWDTNDNTPLVWQIFMWGIPSMLLVLLIVSYWVLKQIDGDVKAVEKYLETGSKKVLGAVKFNFFQYLVSLLIKSETLKKQLFDAEKENQKRKEISDFAELICHDIRSPLEALKFLSSTQEFKKSEERELLDSVVKRIEAIIESLNKKRTNKRESFDLLPYIKNLISEKKIEFKDLDVRFDFESFDLDVPIYIEGDVYVLMRGLSNIINNSVEAMV
ncbi:MAG: hypothetical protein VX642_11230, partial [Bdellovibrionota bacterium]|nr:hypothetical protein [Bdellovibrionota bacterium]